MNSVPSSKNLPLLEHLSELRTALLRASIAFAVGFAVCISYARELYHWLAQPLVSVLPKDSHFIATHPFEAWMTYFKTALIAGFFVSLPFILWPIWHFVAPGLKLTEKKYSILLISVTTILFIAGALFGYIYIFPLVFQFVIEVTKDTDIVFMPQMNEYLGFVFRLLIAFGLTFELPVVIVFLAATKLVSFKTLFAWQKYMIVICFIVAAVLTPPDALSQTLMAIPMIVLYEIGLFIAWIITRRFNKE